MEQKKAGGLDGTQTPSVASYSKYIGFVSVTLLETDIVIFNDHQNTDRLRWYQCYYKTKKKTRQ